MRFQEIERYLFIITDVAKTAANVDLIRSPASALASGHQSGQLQQFRETDLDRSSRNLALRWRDGTDARLDSGRTYDYTANFYIEGRASGTQHPNGPASHGAKRANSHPRRAPCGHLKSGVIPGPKAQTHAFFHSVFSFLFFPDLPFALLEDSGPSRYTPAFRIALLRMGRTHIRLGGGRFRPI